MSSLITKIFIFNILFTDILANLKCILDNLHELYFEKTNILIMKILKFLFKI